MSKKILILGTAVLALSLAGCGKKDKKDETKESTKVEAPADATTDILEEIPAPPDPSANLEASVAWLDKNKARDGVKITESGLQYEILKDNAEGRAVTETDVVTVHYKGMKMDGTVFDSSIARDTPVTFPLHAVIPGWREGLGLMKQGQTMRMSMPPALAYGEAGTPDGTIGPNEAIQFDVELIEVMDLETAQSRAKLEYEKLAEANQTKATAFLSENKTKKDVKVTKSGLQYQVVEKGAGKVSPKATDKVEVNYRGTLLSGQEFDSSYSRGQTASFQLNEVIGAWTEGLQLMHEGDKYRLFVPPALGYGMRGTPNGPIGPNALLIFDVELIDIKDEVATEAAPE
ncbi:MAG: FKBP-type peptidyl-prolyl cis-trans isomerase [Parvularculaceae bacterium]